MWASRRDFFKTVAVGTGSCVLGSSALASNERDAFDDCISLLNDCTRCVGCRACQTACRDHYGFGVSGENPLYDMPVGLEDNHYTVIQLYRDDRTHSFIKRHCMHCNHPSCASACPVGALVKQDNGAVTYDKDKCIGCRYCMVACPFNVPRFEYAEAFPEIQKCSLCNERLQKNMAPVCVEACPVKAIGFGTRGQMIKEARGRIQAEPQRYQPHIYGEKEAGGTSVLYLSAVPFVKLGLLPFDDKPLPELCESVQHGIFKWFAPPLGLMVLLGLIHFGCRKSSDGTEAEKEEKSDG